MVTLLVAVEARAPAEAIPVGSDVPIVGYYQTFGVTARGLSELTAMIHHYLAEDLGSTLVEISEQWVPEFDGVDQDIADMVDNINVPGIWYTSGRAWFHEDEE